MRWRLLVPIAALAISSMTLAVRAQTPEQGAGVATGAVGGAVTGAIVGGPIGAVVGGTIGALAGGTLSAPQATRVQQYVVTQRRPSVRLAEPVYVGETLPRNVELYAVPAEVGVQTPYRYTVVNERTVLVDPTTGRIVQIIQ